MKNLKTKIFSVILAIMLIMTALCFNSQVFATDTDEVEEQISADESETEEATTSEEDELEETTTTTIETYDGDLYVMFGEDDSSSTSYVMDKYVDGNVFILGDDVTITGEINGSLFVLASNVTIENSAYIGCNVFICADTITMEGFTYNMYAVCSSFTLTRQGVIHRDFKLLTDYAYLIGTVGRDFNLVSDETVIYEDEDNCLFIGNNLDYTAPTEIEHIDDITIYGEVTYTESAEAETVDAVSYYVYEAIKNVVFMLVVYLVFIFLAPKFVEKTKEYMSTRALLAGAVGVAFMILIPIIALILLFTSVGTSIAFLMIMIYIAVLMVNSTVTTIAINEFIASKIKAVDTTWKKALMLILTSLVIFIIRQIPYIGPVVSIIVVLVGTGISILYQFDKRKKEKITE